MSFKATESSRPRTIDLEGSEALFHVSSKCGVAQGLDSPRMCAILYSHGLWLQILQDPSQLQNYKRQKVAIFTSLTLLVEIDGLRTSSAQNLLLSGGSFPLALTGEIDGGSNLQ
ncbi:hypothetical protein LguiB_001712 [Lonicera macranthoides]